jgi:hypothetical protein
MGLSRGPCVYGEKIGLRSRADALNGTPSPQTSEAYATRRGNQARHTGPLDS